VRAPITTSCQILPSEFQPDAGQWPDTFYHTSADTPDKVSPESLRRSGALAAAYAYWLATAGYAEAHWLGHWMATRFSVQAGETRLRHPKGCATFPPRQSPTRPAPGRAPPPDAFREERMAAALQTLVG